MTVIQVVALGVLRHLAFDADRSAGIAVFDKLRAVFGFRVGFGGAAVVRVGRLVGSGFVGGGFVHRLGCEVVERLSDVLIGSVLAWLCTVSRFGFVLGWQLDDVVHRARCARGSGRRGLTCLLRACGLERRRCAGQRQANRQR